MARRRSKNRNATSRPMERTPATHPPRSLGENLMLDDDRFSAVCMASIGLGALVLSPFEAGDWLSFVVIGCSCWMGAAYAELVGTPSWIKVSARYLGPYRSRRPVRRKVRGWR
ncbi:MAG: hypothetical protein ACXVXP_10300 [Mycobacteriaceae bacterium]